MLIDLGVIYPIIPRKWDSFGELNAGIPKISASRIALGSQKQRQVDVTTNSMPLHQICLVTDVCLLAKGYLGT